MQENCLKHKKILFMALLIVAIALEWYSAKLAYENYGWLMPKVIRLAIMLNIVSLVTFLKNRQTLALVYLFAIGLAIVPNQLYLSHKLLREREEGANIANYAFQQKLLTGQFPENLTNYQFKYPALKDDFHYQENNRDGFYISFNVGTKNTEHEFTYPGNGRWEYYDD